MLFRSTDRTGAILRVHTSNYRISGFSSMPGIEELAPLAHEKGLLCIDDIGSGQLVDMAPLGLPNDYPLRDSIAAGADIVCFSGDKLMGGVQSGIIAGRETAIGKIRNHPLARAFRCGKMTVLGLEAALKLYYNTDRARREVPTLALLGKPASELKRTADRIRRGIKPPCTARVAAGKTFVGGGSLPDTELDSWTVRLICEGVSAEDLARALRTGRPSVHSRVEENEVVLDVRTLLSGEDRELIAAVNSVKA